jgi:type II secretory pathway pseudopilin PulG
MRAFVTMLMPSTAGRRPSATNVPAGSQPPAAAGTQAGFTLIEVVISTALSLVVFAAILAILASSQRVQARDTELAMTMQEGRAGLGRMAREVRQATKVEEATASTIVFWGTINGASWKIKYDCSVSESGTTYKQCVRYAAKESSTLPSTGTTIVREVRNGSEFFSYAPNTSAPTVVTLKAELPSAGTLKMTGGYAHSIVLENAAFLRNLDLEG